MSLLATTLSPRQRHLAASGLLCVTVALLGCIPPGLQDEASPSLPAVDAPVGVSVAEGTATFTWDEGDAHHVAVWRCEGNCDVSREGPDAAVCAFEESVLVWSAGAWTVELPLPAPEMIVPVQYGMFGGQPDPEAVALEPGLYRVQLSRLEADPIEPGAAYEAVSGCTLFSVP